MIILVFSFALVIGFIKKCYELLISSIEYFSGDIFNYHPVYPEEPLANILTFGPPGAGKVL